ncbi:hypothetical protein H5410_019325 [Solanum commersonii]|uniref:Uncharacterized protein n=1 Tax=Solanum commersonii TaxID=4109 RepID=A0A9J5Z9A6_SOLCO|nr:hypothetical protein H5410_019325 [Solanum commersonii]
MKIGTNESHAAETLDLDQCHRVRRRSSNECKPQTMQVGDVLRQLNDVCRPRQCGQAISNVD